MELSSDETLIGKHAAVLFSKEVSLRGVASVFPWAPVLLAGALLNKVTNTEKIEGWIYITSKRIRFETGSFDKLIGISELEFDVPLEDVSEIRTGRKLLKKTVIIFFRDTAIELSVFRSGKLISELNAVVGT